MSPSRARARLLFTFCAALLLLAGACGGDGPSTRIDREAFVATYVDLRLAALQAPGGKITPERRQEILSTHAVTEEDLLEFAQAHGSDVDLMAAIWGEVEERLATRAAGTDSLAPGAGADSLP